MAREHACVDGKPSTEPSWWFNDGNGIPMFRGCHKCAPEKKKRFRPEILRPYTQNDVDEPIEPEE